MEYRNKAVLRRLKRQRSVWDLASEKRAGMAPAVGDGADQELKPRDSLALYGSSQTQHNNQRKGRLHKASLHLRQSISDLEIPNKLHQVIRRTRSLDDQHAAGETTAHKGTFGPRLRKSISNLAHVIRLNGAGQRGCSPAQVSSKQRTSAAEPAFWEAYRERLRHQNEMEIANEAMRIAHTYDDDNGLQMRRPPQVHEKTLGVLEGRITPLSPVVSEATTFSWSGDRLANIHDFVGLPPPALCFLAADFYQMLPSALPNDTENFEWAGDQWRDFRRFVVAAESQEWVMV